MHQVRRPAALAALLALALAVPFNSRALAEDAPAAALPSVTLPAELDRVLRDYERAWVAKDAAALAGLFTAEGMALPNGSLPARGAARIIEEYARNSGSPLSLRALDYAVAGDLAYVVGGFAPGPERADVGKFVLVLRRGADGRWRIAADMDNMNFLPPRPTAG